ncbi:hypothetical protein PAXRUDRAFT_821863 [Paxillus rubicundulus Ve08.2h10]|uniref:DUF866-domain-containing protein n=1 Tax=Paxillus rubicundulus Ve08.2h10 TaxID=930991 RepID=A0A0D0DN24_9AGAM|nr:hypothetical protein PAXRUDRAFT_821863 [Paxillus rubicundulus Ve08.2h10]
MVRLKLEIKAELSNVTDLKPASDDFEYFFKVCCTSCRETHPKLVSLNRLKERPVSGGKHKTAHLIWRCSNCKHENTAKFDTSIPTRPYTADHSESFSEVLVIECRGLEFTGFDPRGTWSCKGTETKTTFPNVEFEEGEWIDYDEKAALPVQVSFLESRWSRA